MARREFPCGSVVALVAPLAEAQQAGKVPRIGVVIPPSLQARADQVIE
jgi:hypothetical protein